jgi:hypothetical protein
MVWVGCFEKFLKVNGWLSRLTLEITLGGHDILLVRVVRFLIIIVVVAGSK